MAVAKLHANVIQGQNSSSYGGMAGKISTQYLQNRYDGNRERRQNQRVAVAAIEQGANTSNADSAVAVEENGAAATNDEGAVAAEENGANAAGDDSAQGLNDKVVVELRLSAQPRSCGEFGGGRQ